MEAFGGLFVVGILLAGLARLLKALLSKKRDRAPKIDPNWQPPTSDPLPYYAQRYFFSVAERKFYEALKAAVPPSHTIFAKVRIADLVGIRKGTGAWRTHFNKISCKHADFVLCDSSL